MALLFMEGFEMYDTGGTYVTFTGDSRVLEADSFTGYLVASTGGRFNGQSVRLQNVAANLKYKLPTSNDTYYMGFALYASTIATTGGSNGNLVQFQYESGGSYFTQNTLYCNDSGTLAFYNGTSTLLGTTTNSIALGSWNYIVCKCKINDTTGTVEVWLNGVKEIDLTGQDTSASGTVTNISAINFLGGTGFYSYFDDVYVGDTSGTDMTDQVGDCHIEQTLPDANGNRNNFTRVGGGTANYEAVDESPTDDDTTYNHSNTVTDGELYSTGDLVSTNIGTIYAIQAVARVKKDASGSRGGNIICRSSTTEVDSSEIGLTDTYQWYPEIYENDPNGGINWTETAANNAEIGFEIAS